ncbi:hypothetical protein [Dietzia sp. ANT_WB102]|uniref:hypothetical protein n=1 Tax=Dietzia sp. ANT_WB102 TaxID=2597345 RepID=UPI0011EDE438|nr:hypothetical protein [Dietzia sp. ANT_WB102]KAA0917315.1 hypothetical protein FQ137_14105 [Dietzia sp. ANT_WB102]
MVPGSRRRAVGALGLAALTVVGLAGGGCAVLQPTGGAPQVVVTETVATVSGVPVQGGVDSPGVLVETPAELLPRSSPSTAPMDLEAVTGAVTVTAGIAVAPVGGGQIREAGAWRTGVAWSTIKIPLAVAVARTDPQAVLHNAAAITVSDNQAAESLWERLGGGAVSATAVGRLLAEGGDVSTEVPSVPSRPGYSIFGQTRWSLVDQTRFASALPCLPGAEQVIDLMGQIAPDQRWGLGRLPGARFKGGWGPGESGGYLVRQFGVVRAAGGDVAISLAVDAPSFGEGTAAITTMVDAIAPHLASIPGGVC